jgi:hypothetical protein
MIQRIQSLYIAVVVCLSVLLLFNGIVSFIGNEGGEFELRYNGLYQLTGGAWNKTESLFPLTFLLLIVAFLSFITFFLFKWRRLQLRASVLTLLLLLGEVIMIAFYLYYVAAKYEVTVLFSLKITFPIVSAVLMYLAFRGILKDELLVRSYERLR